MSAILTEMITLLTGGITGMATGIGSGVQSLVQNLFIDTTGNTQSLSVFGSVVCIFGGIALAVGLSRLIFNWIQSLGAR